MRWVRHPAIVIPAKAGIQFLEQRWIPACAGMTGNRFLGAQCAGHGAGDALIGLTLALLAAVMLR